MNRKQHRMVRIIAIVLAVLLGFSAVISALLSIAYAEENSCSAPHCEMTIEYLGEEQALRMSQRVVYTNTSEEALDRVIFYAPANLFRRQSALPYESDVLADVLPGGYLPGGIELVGVQVDGSDCDWGFQGEDEMFLRVACTLAPGESCSFDFQYYLLLTHNAAFLGASETDWRLSNFYFTPAALDENNAFILNTPLSFTRYVDTPAMDFTVYVLLPESLTLCGSGILEKNESDGAILWTVTAEGVHDFALHLSTYKEDMRMNDAGVQLRAFTDVRGAADKVLEAAAHAVDICTQWFGTFPYEQLDFAQAQYALENLNHSGSMWLSTNLLKGDTRTLQLRIYAFVAQQYFGCSAWVHPSADAWLSDSISEYLSYLIYEEVEGNDAYLQALNDNLVDSLQLTIPGGLTITSDASLFTNYEYDVIVRNRGAVVFHELRTSMGREDLISGLRLFYEMGQQRDVLTEMNLVEALDAASGHSWEKFLTDWVFNIDEYINQQIDWLD